jgi:hypothetical protein
MLTDILAQKHGETLLQGYGTYSTIHYITLIQEQQHKITIKITVSE